MTTVVQLEYLRVAVGSRVLLDLPRLTIEAGEQVAVVGPNGAGKSTLLKVVGALLPGPQGDVQGHVQGQVQGTVQVLGRTLRAAEAQGRTTRQTSRQTSRQTGARALGAAERRVLRSEIGLLMQGLHLVPRLSARENVLIGALARLQGAAAWRSLLRWYPPALVAEAQAALADLDLADRAGMRADRLSGGERQKVALARVQLQSPRLVLADEPTSALDPAATTQVCLALRALASAPGRTLVTVVHDLDLLPLLATRVIGMADGRVRWDRPLGDVTPPLLQALYQRRCSATMTTEPEPPGLQARLARA
jgi:phosphonate transport system ATP-binding protein